MENTEINSEYSYIIFIEVYICHISNLVLNHYYQQDLIVVE